MKKRTQIKKKRRVPFISFVIQNFNDYEAITNNDDFKCYIYENLIVATQDVIDRKLDEAELFLIENTDICLTITKKDLKTSLLNAIEYYSKKEQYRECSECRDLIEKL